MSVTYLAALPDDALLIRAVGLVVGVETLNHPAHARLYAALAADIGEDELVVLRVQTATIEVPNRMVYYPAEPRCSTPVQFHRTIIPTPANNITPTGETP